MQVDNTIQIPADDRNLGVLAHVGALGGYLLFGCGQILVPLALWLYYRQRSPFIAGQACEALNFHLNMMFWLFISGLLTVVLIGYLGLVVLFFLIVITSILAAAKASQGEYYRYPVTLRIFK